MTLHSGFCDWLFRLASSQGNIDRVAVRLIRIMVVLIAITIVFFIAYLSGM
jgi:hypothetical protein